MTRHAVEVRIPAVIVVRGKVEGESVEAARVHAQAEGERIAQEFRERPVLSGVWPEVLGKASVEALPAAKGSVRVKVEG